MQRDASTPSKKVVLHLPLLLAVVAIGTTKSLLLARKLDHSNGIANYSVPLLTNELPCWGALLILAFVVSYTSRPWLRSTTASLLVLSVLLYALDTALILSVNDRATTTNILKFGFETNSILSFVSLTHLFSLGALLLSALFPISVSKWFRTSILILGGALFLTGEASSTQDNELLRFYRQSFTRDSWSKSFSNDPGPYTREAVAKLASFRPTLEAELPKQIILLVVESLSTKTSARMFGAEDLTPLFDKLTVEGRLYPNAFANYPDSEGGLIALLTGAIPIPYPGSSTDLYKSFRTPDSYVSQFNNRHYETRFLTNGNLEWLSKWSFLRALNFDRIDGPQNNAALGEAPEIHPDMCADEHLYAEALRQITTLLQAKQPFFMTLATASSHLPYKHPHGGTNSRSSIWRYVDQELAKFHKSLLQTSFFEDGLLVITSDHRLMQPVSSLERERFGDSAAARIPVLLIGPGVTTGSVDNRFIQQTELLASIKKLMRGGTGDLSHAPVFVDRYSVSMRYLPGTRGRFTVFEERSAGKVGYVGFVKGKAITWEKTPPPSGEEIEKTLHGQRAFFQRLRRSQFGSSCPSKVLKQALPKDGLVAELYTGTNLREPLTQSSERFVSKEVVQNIDFPNVYARFATPGENFSFVFRGQLTPPAPGRYLLRVEADDGFCLYIDEQLAVGRNELGPLQATEFWYDFSDQPVRLTLNYFQGRYLAGLRLSWKHEHDSAWQVIPAKRFKPSK